jgi:hypothetical protein
MALRMASYVSRRYQGTPTVLMPVTNGSLAWHRAPDLATRFARQVVAISRS